MIVKKKKIALLLYSYMFCNDNARVDMYTFMCSYACTADWTEGEKINGVEKSDTRRVQF